jgi:hypothetical protein
MGDFFREPAHLSAHLDIHAGKASYSRVTYAGSLLYIDHISSPVHVAKLMRKTAFLRVHFRRPYATE